MSDVQEGKQIENDDALEVIFSSALCFAKLRSLVPPTYPNLTLHKFGITRFNFKPTL